MLIIVGPIWKLPVGLVGFDLIVPFRAHYNFIFAALTTALLSPLSKPNLFQNEVQKIENWHKTSVSTQIKCSLGLIEVRTN